jgi:hypothetical protein
VYLELADQNWMPRGRAKLPHIVHALQFTRQAGLKLLDVRQRRIVDIHHHPIARHVFDGCRVAGSGAWHADPAVPAVKVKPLLKMTANNSLERVAFYFAKEILRDIAKSVRSDAPEYVALGG